MLQIKNTSKMGILLKVLAVVLLSILAMFLIKKLVEGVFNLKVVFRKDHSRDISKQKNGIVLNTETKKLEADQSLILPF